MQNINKPLLFGLLILPVVIILLLIAFGIVYTRSLVTQTIEDSDIYKQSNSLSVFSQTSRTGATLATFTALDNSDQQYINLPLSKLEIADTDLLRTQGLMFREELCYSCGMLFVFEDEQVRNFWMKDTRVSLDIIFIKKDGTVINIAEKTKPEQTAETYQSKEAAQYVLEVNAGWSNSNSLKAGSKLKINVL